VIRTLPLEVRSSQGQRAGLFSRTAASLIDVFVGAVVLVAGYLAVAMTLFVLRPRTFRWPAPGRFALAVAGAAIVVVYLVAGWTTTGRTLGTQVMGLRVVAQSGARLRIARASVRAILCVFFPLGLLWGAVDRRGRAVHDLLLRTAVIYDWRRGTLVGLEDRAAPKRDPEPRAAPAGPDRFGSIDASATDPC
jgi:uncharacterized RDD family membrane protein YckC